MKPQCSRPGLPPPTPSISGQVAVSAIQLVFTQVELHLKRDDGAVIYLNGTEILRDNLPAGALHLRDLCHSAVEGSAEDELRQFILPPQPLLSGTNLLAVEIHRSGATDQDSRLTCNWRVWRRPASFSSRLSGHGLDWGQAPVESLAARPELVGRVSRSNGHLAMAAG